MKLLPTLCILMLFLTACNKHKRNIRDEDQNPNLQADTLFLWHPEEKEEKHTDTSITFNNKEYIIELSNYTLNTNVVFDYTDNDKVYCYNYRNYGANIRIAANESDVFSISLKKEDFNDFIHPDLIKAGILKVRFKGMVDNEFLFEISVGKPETCWVYFLKYFIDLNGEIKIEEYPDDYYEME